MNDKSKLAVTVTGEIPVSDLGIVAMREMIMFGLPGWDDDPTIAYDRPQAYAAARTRLEAFKAAGGGALVDSGGAMLGRNARMLVDISKATGVHIVATAGLPRESQMPGHILMAFAERSERSQKLSRKGPDGWIPDAENFAEMIKDELERGMTVGGMMRSPAKAGLIRSASGQDKISDLEVLAIQGAGIAQRRTGAAVWASGINQAQRHLDLLSEAGAKLNRIVVGSCDDGRALDVDRDRKLAKDGSYIAFDHIGWEDGSAAGAISDDQRIELIKAMVDDGFTDRVILSSSAIGYGLGAPTTAHGFSHLLESFVPQMKKAGVADGDIHTMLVDNPGRLLSFETLN